MLIRSANASLICLMIIVVNIISDHHFVQSKVFTRCQFAKELAKNKIERTFISNWVCLAENESNLDTTTIIGYPNLSASYGLFQFNNRTTCRNGRRAGFCNMKCEDFLDDKIEDDIKCAKLIWEQNGFKVWKGWMKKCYNRILPNVSKCF